jgi:hypothetical protein
MEIQTYDDYLKFLNDSLERAAAALWRHGIMGKWWLPTHTPTVCFINDDADADLIVKCSCGWGGTITNILGEQWEKYYIHEKIEIKTWRDLYPIKKEEFLGIVHDIVGAYFGEWIDPTNGVGIS